MTDPSKSRSRDTSPSQSPQSHSSESIYTDYGSIRSHSGRDKSPTRLKKAHKKVRTGCITCRNRRVKCDEKKPGCDRCAKADRECEGYRDLVGITKETSAPSTESASILSRPDLSQFSTFLEEEEMTRPCVAFLEQTAPRMAAWFTSMVESVQEDRLTTLHLADKAQCRWKSLIPDASQHDAATRYAAVALSILHQSLQKAPTVGWQDSGFARYYHRAIAIVKEGQSVDPLHHMLLPCILFAHCELLMGSLSEVMTHIISGSRIITDMQSSGLPLPAVVKNVIAPILNGFIAKSQISGQFDAQFHFSAATNAILAQFESIPTAFASFAEAGRSLCELLYQTLLLQELGQPSDRHQATAIRKQANNWSEAFDGLRFAESNIKSGQLRKFQLILLAQHRMLQLLLKCMPPEADVYFQHAASDFKIMLAQIRTFVNEVNQGGGIDRSMRNVIPVHAGVTMPLFFIAIHCRTVEVRHEALDLLESLSLTEGQWTSCLAHAIAVKLNEVTDSVAQSRGKLGLMLGSPARLQPVGLEKTFVGHIKLQCLDVTAEGRIEDISEDFIDDDRCQDDINASWPFRTILRCHGFQGPIRSQNHQCRYQDSSSMFGIPGNLGVSPFTSPSLYQMQPKDSYFLEPLDESVLDPTAFFNYGIHRNMAP